MSGSEICVATAASRDGEAMVWRVDDIGGVGHTSEVNCFRRRSSSVCSSFSRDSSDKDCSALRFSSSACNRKTLFEPSNTCLPKSVN